MKARYIIIPILMCMVSCQHKISFPVDYNVILDSGNTYYAGDPVTFNFGNAEVDNLVFYSGETGHQFCYKDRYDVAIEDVKSAKLVLRYQGRYGQAGALDVYVTRNAEMPSGNDAAADRLLVQKMSAEAASSEDRSIEGWTRLDYAEGASTVWTTQEYDITDYLEGFSIALHWHPATNQVVQRTYWISGNVEVELVGMAPSSMTLPELGFISVSANDEVEDPYEKNGKNGTVIFNKTETADIVMQGAPADGLTYAIDSWVFSIPKQLTKVAPDRGEVIKTMQNYLDSYSYIYEQPGYYTATFVGI